VDVVNPRIRRLIADHEQVSAALASHPRIKLVGAEGSPPEQYVIEYQLAGLIPDAVGGFSRGTAHRAEIQLSLDYPRRPPFCRMVTPVFHPNIDPQKICIGDHWNAGQSLLDLIVRIGQMIAYQSYNVKSPLNAKAAVWAEQHEADLPLEKVDLSPGT